MWGSKSYPGPAQGLPSWMLAIFPWLKNASRKLGQALWVRLEVRNVGQALGKYTFEYFLVSPVGEKISPTVIIPDSGITGILAPGARAAVNFSYTPTVKGPWIMHCNLLRDGQYPLSWEQCLEVV